MRGIVDLPPGLPDFTADNPRLDLCARDLAHPFLLMPGGHASGDSYFTCGLRLAVQ
jgi:hypothetical protein